MTPSMIRIYPQDPTTWLTFHLGLQHIPIYFDISAHEKSLFLFFYKCIMLNEVKNLFKTSDGNGFEPLDFTSKRIFEMTE